MNIGIIGLGYVGLTLAMAAADAGINVYGVEVSEMIKKSLAKGKAHFYEPGLDALIRRLQGKTFYVVDKFPQDVTYDAFIITVGTPLRDDSKEPDFNYIRSALQGTLADVYDGSQMIILRSTVSVGTTNQVVVPFLKEMCKGDNILVGMCPERTIEGNAVHELKHLPQVISGNNEQALEVAEKLFRHITPFVIRAESIEEAELIKLYCNTYRDMTFAIGNVFCQAAQTFGVDGIKAIEHANWGYSRSNIAKPGFVAGPCLEKDAYILIRNMPQCKSRDFILAARQFNESMEDVVVSWVEEKVGSPDGKVITLTGMTFKGVPETSDLRGSSSVYIARKLKAKGYKMRLHDYVALPDEMKSLDLGDYFENLSDACVGTSALLVLNNHKKYGSILPESFMGGLDFPILDSWGVCSELNYAEGVDLYTLGNMNI